MAAVSLRSDYSRHVCAPYVGVIFSGDYALKVILLLIFLYSSSSLASCKTTTDEFAWDGQLADKLEISATNREGIYEVEIDMPAEIEEMEFRGVTLYTDNINSPSHTFPLDTTKDGVTFSAWYILRAELIRKHFVVARYGKGGQCPIYISKRVVFE